MKTISRHRICFFLLFQLLIIGLLYYKSAHYNFIDLDDQAYVAQNAFIQQGLSIKNILWAFTFEEKSGFYWHPLTWICHMTDITLFGKNAGAHHVVNVFWHILNASVLFLFLIKATKNYWASVFTALLFAVHPINLESVVWIAERKNIVSTFFYFLTLLLYARYVRRPKIITYLLPLLTFALGLMAKPMVVSLPLVLIICDYWPLNRFQFPFKSCSYPIRYFFQSNITLLLEKIPFFVLAAFGTYLSTISLHEYNNFVPYSSISLIERIANIPLCICSYIAKLFYPAHLSIFYPYPETLQLSKIILSLAIVLILSLTFLIFLRKQKFLTSGWLWFLITLGPVSGLVQTGATPLIAERFAYIPSAGLYIVVSWSLFTFLNKRDWLRHLAFLLAGFIIILLGVITWQKIEYWKDTETLFNEALATVPHNTYIEDGLLRLKIARNDNSISYKDYIYEVGLDPDFVLKTNLFILDREQQRYAQSACKAFSTYIEQHPDDAGILFALGKSQLLLKKYKEATSTLAKAERLSPQNSRLVAPWIIATVATGDVEKAKRLLSPISHSKFNTRELIDIADAFLNANAITTAKTLFNEALKKEPTDYNILNNLGVIALQEQQYNNALTLFTNALFYEPPKELLLKKMAALFFKQMETSTALSEEISQITATGPPDRDALLTFTQHLDQLFSIRRMTGPLVEKYLDTEISDTTSVRGTTANTAAAASSESPLLELTSHFAEMIADSDNPLVLHTQIALFYERLHDNASAIEHYTKALKIEPNNAAIHYNMANLYASVGKTEEAKYHFIQAVKIMPNFVQAESNLAILLAKEELYDEALDHFRKAITLAPEFMDARINMAVLLVKMGKKKEGLHELQRAKEISPDNTYIDQMIQMVKRE